MPPTRRPDDPVTYPDHMRAVTFPTAAAEAAKVVCDRIAALLNEHMLARTDLVAGARDGWEGAHRTEFDETWRLQQVRLDDLKQDLQRLSGNITTAMANVASVNTQRATLREDYRAQLEQPVTAGP